MPRSRTVLKRQRQTEVRRVRNKAVRSELKTLERKVRAGGDAAATELRSLQREPRPGGREGCHPPEQGRPQEVAPGEARLEDLLTPPAVGGASPPRERTMRSTIDEGGRMPTYILLSSLNPGGLETLKERPDRLREVNQEIERMGGHVKDQYAVLGPFDFVTILEAPDNATVAKISVGMGARGTVRIQSLPATPVEEFIESLKSR